MREILAQFNSLFILNFMLEKFYDTSAELEIKHRNCLFKMEKYVKLRTCETKIGRNFVLFEH